MSQVHFESLVRSPLRLYVLFDPALSKTGDDDTGSTAGGALVAADSKAASALVAQPAFDAESSGYLGTSDGWTDLQDYRMDWTYPSAPTPGDIVQTGQTWAAAYLGPMASAQRVADWHDRQRPGRPDLRSDRDGDIGRPRTRSHEGGPTPPDSRQSRVALQLVKCSAIRSA